MATQPQMQAPMPQRAPIDWQQPITQLPGQTPYQAPDPETGPLENFNAGVREMEIAGNIGSQDSNLAEAYRPVLDALDAVNARYQGQTYMGAAPMHFLNPANLTEDPLTNGYANVPGRSRMRQMVFDEIRRQRQRRPNFLPGVPDNADEFERQANLRTRAELQGIRETQANASTLGRIGGFFGGVAGSFEDPVNLATLPIGGAETTFVRQAGRAFIENAFIEALSQPLVVQNYANLGETQTLTDSATSVLMAGVAGSAFHVGAHAFSEIGARTLGPAYDHIAQAVFNSLPDHLQRAWADSATIGDHLLVDVLHATVPQEQWTPDLHAAVNVVQRDADISSASPYEPSRAGDEAHGQALADTLRAIVDGAHPITVEAPMAAPSPQVASGRFMAPVRGTVTTIPGGEYGAPRNYGRHVGTDYAAAAGSPIYPMAPATVRGGSFSSAGGNTIELDLAGGWRMRVLHMREPTSLRPGQQVGVNDAIGAVGATGTAAHGNHAHVELYDPSGRRVDPASMIGRDMTATTAPPDRSLARGIRNNNFGNIREGDFARSQPGYRGADNPGTNNRMAIYDTPEAGIAAQEALLAHRYLATPRSIEQIIRGTGHNDGYSPSVLTGGDNPEASVRAYITHLSERLGVDPHAMLSRADVPRLAEAMRDIESPGWRHARVEPPSAAPPNEAIASAEDVPAEAASAPVLDPADASPDIPVLRRGLFGSEDEWLAAQSATARRLAGEPADNPPPWIHDAARQGLPSDIAHDVYALEDAHGADSGWRQTRNGANQIVQWNAITGELVVNGRAVTKPVDAEGFAQAVRRGSEHRSAMDATAIRVYHGGAGVEGNIRAPFFASEDRGFAKSYAADRGHGAGRVEAFDLRASKIASQDDIDAAARSAGLSEAQVAQGGGTLLDEAFTNAAPQIIAELRRQGFDVARFHDFAVNEDHGGIAYAALDPAAISRAESRSSRPLPSRSEISTAALVASVRPEALAQFDQPMGKAALAHTASLEHDLMADIEKDPGLRERPFIVDAVGESATLDAILQELDADKAAAVALRGCL